MIVSYFFAGGALINGIFNFIRGTLAETGGPRIFVISACFFLAGRILKSVLYRNK